RAAVPSRPPCPSVPMNLSDEWRSLFPVSSVFTPPSLASLAAGAAAASSSSSRGPLLFSPLPPPTSLLSLPFHIPPPPAFARGDHRLFRAFVSADSFL